MNATNKTLPTALAALLLMIGLCLVTLPTVAQEPPAQEAAAQESSAQTIAPARIGTINSQRLMTESIAGQEAMTKLKQLADSKQAEGQGMQAAIEDLRRQINEGRLSLSEEKLAELQKEMESQTVALRRFGDDAERELERSRQEELGGIERQLMPLIQEVGDELGLTFVLDQQGSGLLYADEGTDITDLVLKRFNAVLSAAGN